MIDYFIVCPRFFELISSMEVDENRKYVLTKYSSRLGTKCIVKSDHNPLICTLNVKWDKRIKCERKEIFKLKDKEGLRMFNELTSNCPRLVELSNNSSNFLIDAEQWMKKIKDIMQSCFKKIRITGKGKSEDTEVETLMNAKQKLLIELGKLAGGNIDGQNQLKRNIDMIENEISIICSEQNSKIVKEHLAELSNNEDQVCRLNMWRLRQRLCPRNIDPPMAKKDANGQLVSEPVKLKQLYVSTYKKRLRHRDIRPEYKQIESLKNYLFNIRLSVAKI